MYALVTEPIDPQALEPIAGPAHGALASFYGIVRDRAADGRPVLGLHYEAHEAMARAEFETIAREAAERFGEVRLAIVHRVGELGIGEIAVAVLAAAAHRDAAFDACRFAIDELKRRAPIWKKERYAAGDERWIANAP